MHNYNHNTTITTGNHSVSNTCNVGMSDLPDIYICTTKAQELRAYISGKSLMPMLQLICYIALWQLESGSSQKTLS